MAERIEHVIVDFLLDLRDGRLSSIMITYTPVSTVRTLEELTTIIRIEAPHLERHLAERLGTMVEFLTAELAHREFEFQGDTVSLTTTLSRVYYFPKHNALGAVFAGGKMTTPLLIPIKDLTDGQRRLLDSVIATSQKLAWDHLAERLNARPAPRACTEVLISYRSTKQNFAEALALRLGREGVVPFFDKWDVKAGDSIPGKIEEAFARSMACIIVLSDDFTLGHWATAEMETAVTKRIEEEYKVIPVLYEKCDVPELLKPLRHVDFSDHDPQIFESKFGELIDAIYGLELNPFRS